MQMRSTDNRKKEMRFKGAPSLHLGLKTVGLVFVFYGLFSCSVEAAQAQDCVDPHSRTGQCLGLSACPQLIEEFYTGTRSQAVAVDFQTFVSDFICGFDGRNFMICCAIRNAAIAQSTNSSADKRSIRFGTTAAQPQPGYELTLGSLFQFAPLTTLNGGSPTYQPVTTTPVVFQPSIAVSSPGTPQTPSIPPTFNPTPPSRVIAPTPPSVTSTPPTSSGGGPIVVGPTKPTGDCGISRGATNRVVGGSEARRGSYPWMAALGYYDESDRSTLKYLCGGSLISPKHVLTSAHCVTPTLAIVRLGAHDLSRSSEPNAIDLQVKRVIVHEGFDIRSIANDIALLELSAAAPMTDFIGIICLPEASSFLSQDFVGMNPFIAGWGAIKHQGPTSNALRDAQVPIVSRQICEQSYKTVFRFIEFSDKLICAGSSNADACQGDSGGPLMLPSQTNGGVYRYFLLGIVSYGYECARSGFPGVYTRVASYIPWIKAHLTSI